MVALALAVAGCSAKTAPTTSAGQTTAQATRGVAAASFARLPLRFEENRGQLDERVRFVARQGGLALFLTDEGAVLSLRQEALASTRNRGARPKTAKSVAPPKVLKLKVRGGQSAELEAGERLVTRSNYFLGRDPAKWRTNVPNFREVAYRSVRPGVDLVFHGSRAGRLEYDFVVAPGVAPDVALDFEGADSVRIADDGSLEIAVAGTVLRQLPPTVYQTFGDRRQEVSGRYRSVGTTSVAFSVAAYDPTRPLVIDPVLVYSTFLGGGNADDAFAVAVDGTGAAYLAGSTNSANFPVTNAVQMANGGGSDLFVAKLTPQADALVYSTYLGGSGDDFAHGLAVDGTGAVAVAGGTLSTDFPVTNALQSTPGPNTGCVESGGELFCIQDGIVAKLTPAGSALVYSTYLGGSGDDVVSGIATDGTGAVYVAGFTASADFPVANAFQSASGSPGRDDAFVAKLTPAGSALAYSTYLGGNGDDLANSIAVDGTGAVYVAGFTVSTDFPVANAFQSVSAGNGDAFVTKLTPAGNTLVYSTYLGGSGGDAAEGVAVDGTGAAYVAGNTRSPDFPVKNAIQSQFAGGLFDGFVAKLAPTGNALAFATYLGGGAEDEAGGVAVDGTGAATVVGSTASSDFPVANALQNANAGGVFDAFVATLTPAGDALAFSTYLGGALSDSAFAVALDRAGAAYVAGLTDSNDFPISHALQGAPGGSFDAFLAKISPTSGGCTPTTCAAQGATCGSISDGCGGTLNCGTCTTGTCGGGGVPNQCGGGCTAFVDDFTGTSLGSNWSIAHGAFSVSGGAAHGTAPSSYAVWVGTPDANAPVGITLGASTSQTYAGVIARGNSSVPNRDHYAAYVAPDGRVGLARRNAYVYTYLGVGPQAGSGVHRIQLTATGTGPVALTVTLDGATVITATDSSTQALGAAGRAGIFDYNGASRPLEHFVVGQSSCSCTPTTCAAQGATCGSISDGCGGTLNCGTCTTGTCGGGGVPNHCGCTPTTCAAQGATCGSISDGCGGTLNCGTCTTGTCGGGGVPNHCGSSGATFTDDFTGTSLGPNWIVAFGAFSVSSGAAHGTAENSYAVWIGSPSANAPVAVTLGAPTAPTYAGVIARANPAFPQVDHYAAYLAPDGTVALARRNNWNYSYLGTGPRVSGGGHRIQLTATGTSPVTLTVTLDSATVITATDSSPQALAAAGRAGIFDFNGASRPLQHFTVGP